MISGRSLSMGPESACSIEMPVGRRLLGAIEAVAPSVGWKSRVGGHPCARDEEQPASAAHRLNGVIDGSHIILRERRVGL